MYNYIKYKMSKSCNCQCTCSKPQDVVEGGNVVSTTDKPKRKRSKKVKADETLPQVELPTPEVKTKKSRKKKTESQVVDETKEKTKRKPSSWVLHVQKFRIENPEVSYKDAMTAARETYNK